MKVQPLSICIVLLAVSICGAGYAQSNPAMQPGAMLGQPAGPKVTAPATGQPSLSRTMPSATMTPGTMAPAPATAGAGPSTGSPAIMPGTAMTTDNNFVYVMQNGMLYKLAKSDVSNCGTPFPPACGPGPTPACGTCGGISYIPGYAGSCLSTTTCAPCPGGSGPCQTTVKCNPSCAQPCPTTCPSPSTCPTNCQPTCPCKSSQPSSCAPCGSPCPQPTTSCTTTLTPASIGAGPCAVCPPVASVSACAQNTIACLSTLCGAEADRAYLQALMQLNLQVLALSDASAQYLGTTSLQDYATNSIADSKSRIALSEKWLKNKFCLAVVACPPSLGGFDICDIRAQDKAFDEGYKNQLVQFYVDEIAISQVEMERGLDYQVKAAAARVIKDDQARITKMKRCSICGVI